MNISVSTEPMVGGPVSDPAEAYKKALDAFLAPIAERPYNPPLSFGNRQHIDEVLLACVARGASEVTLRTGQPPIAEIHGKSIAMSNRRLSEPEIVNIVTESYGGAGLSLLGQAKDLDLAYNLTIDRRLRIRFRLNVTGIHYGDSHAAELTFRMLGSLPPTLDQQHVDPELKKHMIQKQGLVLVTGPTGHGKTTLLGGLIRELASMPEGIGKIVTYESPIEFIYDDLPVTGGFVSQTSIPNQLPSFAAGGRNALRRKPGHIMIGETRDRETVEAICEAALTGHPVSSTAHTNSVAETPPRLLKLFGRDNSASAAVDLIGCMRLIVNQNLVRTTDGKRAALREYMHFDEETRLELVRMDPDKWPGVLPAMVRERGRPMIRDAEMLFDAGRITENTFRMYQTRDEKEVA